MGESAQREIDVRDHVSVAEPRADIDVMEEWGEIPQRLAARRVPDLVEMARRRHVLARPDMAGDGAASAGNELVDHALRIGRDGLIDWVFIAVESILRRCIPPRPRISSTP